uniref:Uncharacterized protein n=1 Tax=Arundo donax TaxID=35708 RepID=A0A0A9HZ70_ARUDO
MYLKKSQRITIVVSWQLGDISFDVGKIGEVLANKNKMILKSIESTNMHRQNLKQKLQKYIIRKAKCEIWRKCSLEVIEISHISITSLSSLFWYSNVQIKV